MKSLEGQTCPFCGAGKFVLTTIDYEAELPDAQTLVVPNLPVERCDQCGETVFPAESSQRIDSAIAEGTEQLTPRELERIRDDLGVDQTEMSEILGLGGKTYHRWENGSQYPSRSMGYYIRLLHEFRDAFDWLRERGWRGKNRVRQFTTPHDFAVQFPDLAGKGSRGASVSTGATMARERRSNPARGLALVCLR
jgi:putative zinc finger/helix-turn-helix YgiT family protein